MLTDVDVRTGHTLVHYLYTNQYETPNTSDELEHALQVYIVARNYSISNLAELAMHHVKCLCDKMDILQIMRSIEPIFTKLRSEGSSDSPVHDILVRKIIATFDTDVAAFESDEFRAHLDKAGLMGFLLKIMMQLQIAVLKGIRKEDEELEEYIKRFQVFTSTHNGYNTAISCEENLTAQKHHEQGVLESAITSAEAFPPPEEAQPGAVCLQHEVPPKVEQHDQEFPKRAELDVKLDNVHPADSYLDIAAEAVAVKEVVQEDPWASWGLGTEKKKKKKKTKKGGVPVPIEETKSPEAERRLSQSEAVNVICAPDLVLQEICPNQAWHLYGGDKGWKSCKQCGELVARAVQQAAESELALS